jgi:putative ABC transport system substrate-binding protein
MAYRERSFPASRREFMALVSAAAAAYPLAARAQQPAMPLVGFLFSGTPELNSNVGAAFRKGLGEQGFVEARNVAIEYQWAQNEYDRLPELAADLVRRRPAVIAALGGLPQALAAQAATKTVPIVFQYGQDPVEDGLVASFNKPGGNITGFTSMNSEIDGKRLGLLCELVPSAVRLGFLGGNPNNQARIRSVQSAAAALGREIEIFPARTSRDIDDVFANLVQKQIDAILAPTNPILMGLRLQLATAAARDAPSSAQH